MLRFITLVCALFIITSCRPPVSSGGTNKNTTDNNSNVFGNTSCVDFETGISSIISQNCLQCHDAGLNEPDLSQAGDNLSELSLDIARTIEEGSMPPSGPLDDSDKELVAAWQSSGFPKSGTDCPSADTGPNDIDTFNPDAQSLPGPGFGSSDNITQTGSSEAVQFGFDLWNSLKANNYICLLYTSPSPRDRG